MVTEKHIRLLSLAAGALLAVIGIRFLVVPDSAARTFGLAKGLHAHELHTLVGLRDLWLSGLVIAFALLREWRALALWFLLAVPVCLADSAVAAASSGKAWAIAFHAGSGLVCLLLGVAAWQWGGRRPGL